MLLLGAWCGGQSAARFRQKVMRLSWWIWEDEGR
ncbi:hypothetical protein V6N11_068361, partial [Hibiscus sabdariffa]